MATRTLIIDLRQGSGNEPMYGVVTVQRIQSTSKGNFEVLPWETTLKLVDGKATIVDAVTDGTGPMYDTAYLIRVMNGYCASRWGFMAALPDGDTPLTTGEMPKVNPLTGEGVYMDAQEWNALYGQLPDRVSALESSQSAQDTTIAGKADKVHSHVIGDVTGLQTALNGKGNATLRVDTSVGKRVFISDGTAEHLVYADTGYRDISSLLPAGITKSVSVNASPPTLRRINSTVTIELFLDVAVEGSTTILGLMPDAFRPRAIISRPNLLWIDRAGVGRPLPSEQFPWYLSQGAIRTSGAIPANSTLLLTASWDTKAAWPTTLPGTPA